MRFRKSIKIMKGVRLNFSKSGLSLTTGVRGASVNFGPKGTYLNTGIPGTGLYDRTRIGGGPVSTSRSSQSSGKTSIKMHIQVGIDDNGEYFIRDGNGQTITDESILRQIKRSQSYKDKIVELSEQFVSEKQNENHRFINIHELAPEIVNEKEILNEIEHTIPQRYQKRSFPDPEPNESYIRAKLTEKAKRDVKTLAFWKIRKLREEYVNIQFPDLYRNLKENWTKKKQTFLDQETAKESQKNEEYLLECERRKSDLRLFLSGEQSWVENHIEAFLEGMTLPVNFSVSYKYESSTGRLKVDLDLPEIDDLPTTKAVTLASGKAKVKKKSQKEIKKEYVTCVSGLAFFFAASLFNVSTNISKILISGFTQRVNKKTGHTEDEYVYSIVFDREKFAIIHVMDIDPIVAFDNFSHVRNLNKTFDLGTIAPLAEFPSDQE